MPTGQNTTNTVQNSEPWAGAQPFLLKGMEEAGNLYDIGGGFAPFPDSTVVPFSGQTQSALTGMEGLATAGNPLSGAASSNALNVLSSGGMTLPGQLNTLGGMYDIATGAQG